MPAQLTALQHEWLIKNYLKTPNAVIEKKLSISHANLKRLALQYWLRKDADYLSKIRRNAAKKRWQRKKRKYKNKNV